MSDPFSDAINKTEWSVTDVLNRAMTRAENGDFRAVIVLSADTDGGVNSIGSDMDKATEYGLAFWLYHYVASYAPDSVNSRDEEL